MMRNRPEREDQPTTEQPSADRAAPSPRRPYTAPRLRHLGSVRELTLGATKGKFEGFGTYKSTM